MIPRTVLLKRTVTTDNQRIEAMGQWSRVMAELGMDEPLLVVRLSRSPSPPAPGWAARPSSPPPSRGSSSAHENGAFCRRAFQRRAADGGDRARRESRRAGKELGTGRRRRRLRQVQMHLAHGGDEGCRFVRAKAGWTPRWALADLAGVLSVQPFQRTEDLLRAITIELMQRPR
jgi:hypothetical protein